MLNKKTLPLIRKVLPNKIAQDIVGVQPMTQAAGEIFTLKSILTSGWSEWEKKFVFLPKRTVNGKWVVGNVYEAFRITYEYDIDSVVGEISKTEFKWATSKDIFVEKLKDA